MKVFGMSIALALLAGGAAAAPVEVNTIAGAFAPGVWYDADVRDGGTTAVVDLTGLGGNLESGAPLGVGAARLTTGPANNNDKAEIGLGGDLGTVSDFLNGGGFGYSYYKSSSDVNAFAAASFKITVLDTNVTTPGTTDGFTTFVYEPNWNQTSNPNVSTAPPTDQWTDIVLSATEGLFWHTGLYNEASIAAGGAGLQRTMQDWLSVFGNDFLDAQILGVSIGVGTFNLGQTAYVDNVRVNAGQVDETYDFEAAATQVSAPGSLALLVLGLGAVGFAARRRKA